MLVSGLWARAVGRKGTACERANKRTKERDSSSVLACKGLEEGNWERTITSDGVRGLVDNLGRALDSKAVPFLHGSAIDILLGVLLWLGPLCELGVFG